MPKTNTHRSLQSEHLTRVMISPRVWSHLEGTQAYADVRSDRYNPEVYCHTLLRKIRDTPTTRKDGRIAVRLTADEMSDLRHQVEAMREGAADNTWDADGRADLFAANALLQQLAKVGA